jgi:hypothetical protein
VRWVIVASVASACAASARPARPLVNAPPPREAPAGAYGTRTPAGPYRSMADWCADLARRDHADARTEYVKEVGDDEGYEDDPSYGCRAPYTPLVTRGATSIAGDGAIARAELVPTSSLALEHGCAVLLHVDDRIFAIEDATACLPPPDENSIYHEIALELAWRDLVAEGVGPELVISISTTRDTASSLYGDRSTRSMYVCGAGASRRARCTPEIPIAMHDPAFLIDYRPAIGRDGTLRFAVDDHGGGGLDLDDDSYDRSYTLRFP